MYRPMHETNGYGCRVRRVAYTATTTGMCVRCQQGYNASLREREYVPHIIITYNLNK